jgi:hypothetical protein
MGRQNNTFTTITTINGDVYEFENLSGMDAQKFASGLFETDPAMAKWKTGGVVFYPIAGFTDTGCMGTAFGYRAPDPDSNPVWVIEIKAYVKDNAFRERDTFEVAQVDADNDSKILARTGVVYRTEEGKFVGMTVVDLKKPIKRVLERGWIVVGQCELQLSGPSDWKDAK